MKRNKILILGGSGFIGKHLVSGLKKKFDVVHTYHSNVVEDGVFFDSTTMKVASIVDLNSVLCCIIAFGCTKPELCYKEKELTTEINVESTKRIINSLIKNHIKIIFLSSHYVFDGEKGDYVETDIPTPSLFYGKQKLLIEDYIKKKCNDYLIMRLDKVVSGIVDDTTIFSSWINSIHNSESIDCSVDQVFSPIDVRDVVFSINKLIDLNECGVFHVSGIKTYKRIELLELLIDELKKYVNVNIRINKKFLSEFNKNEKIPKNINLKSNKLLNTINHIPINMEQVIAELAKNYVINKNLFDSNLVYEDASAKTKSYYCRNGIIGVNQNLISQLVDKSNEYNGCDIRICLHKDNDALMHSMIIILHEKNHYLPHKHTNKSETYHIISGGMNVYIFNDNGNIIKIDTISKESNIIYRMPEDTWHAIVPISEYVIFNESKNGPFIREIDSVFPSWDYKLL